MPIQYLIALKKMMDYLFELCCPSEATPEFVSSNIYPCQDGVPQSGEGRGCGCRDFAGGCLHAAALANGTKISGLARCEGNTKSLHQDIRLSEWAEGV